MLSAQIINNLRKLLIKECTHTNTGIRNIYFTTAKCREVDDRKEMYRSLPAADEGTAGEKAADIDSLLDL